MSQRDLVYVGHMLDMARKAVRELTLNADEVEPRNVAGLKSSRRTEPNRASRAM